VELLLDTHALVWLVAGSTKLGRTARRRIDGAERVGVSAVSYMEVGLLMERGRLRISDGLGAWRRDLVAADIDEVELSAEAAVWAAGLSTLEDPFDRLIAASARSVQRTLVTADTRILHWARRSKELRVLDARR
jgi:PIN domain nuclease of toxin-antitoxin system